MKKLFIVIMMLLASYALQAQRYEDGVKFLPYNLHYNSATIEWEHQEGKNSLIVGIGIPYWSSILGRSYGEFTLDNTNFNSAKLYTYTIRAAYRHYFSNTPMEGLYLEGYIKSQTLDWRTHIINPATKTIAGALNGYFYTVSPGLQLGYQYMLNKHFLVDFYILGIEMCRVNGNAVSTSTSIADRNYTNGFVNDLANRYLPKNAQKLYSVSTDNTTANYKLEGFGYPWFRLGISVGYRF